MLKKITVFKFQFKVFVLTTVTLFLIGTVFSYLSAAMIATSEQPTLWVITFEAIS